MNGTYIVAYNHGELYGEINLFINCGIYVHDNEELYIYIYIYICWRHTYIGYCMLNL